MKFFDRHDSAVDIAGKSIHQLKSDDQRIDTVEYRKSELAAKRNFTSPCFSGFPGWESWNLEPCQTPTRLENFALKSAFGSIFSTKVSCATKSVPQPKD